MARSIVQRYFAGLSRNTFLLAFAGLFADISTEMLYPVLPIFLTQTLNASGSIVGLVEGVAQATQNIVQGFSGALSDKLQKRKPIALVGYLLAAIAKPLIGLSTVWQGVLGARVLDRFGAGSSALLHVMRSSRHRWMSQIEAEPLGLKASATMPARSWGRYWPFSSFFHCSWTFVTFFIWRFSLGYSPS
jgi:hypothetical protein